MKSDALIEQVLNSPELPFAAERLNAILEAERPLRERFCDEVTEDGKVEFINGRVVVQSPAMLRHIEAVGRLSMLLRPYVKVRKMGIVTQEKALVCLKRNDYEPGIAFFGKAKAGQLGPTQLKFPAPDWVCEFLSDSTESTDRGTKFDDYGLHGVGEYWIVDLEKQAIEKYLLQAQTYQLAQLAQSGTIESRVIEGFKIPVKAVFDDDIANEALRAILAV